MIYKYFTANEYSLSNLIRDELFCQNYKAFNDPFECWFLLKEGIPLKESDPQRFNNICEAWGYEPKDGNNEDFTMYMEELKSYQPDVMRYINAAKISCFSKNVDNLLMWSHYADGLRGFCLEFDEKEILSKSKNDFTSIIPVSYAKKPPVVDKMLYALANDQIWYHEMAIEEDLNRADKPMYQKALKEAKEQLNNLYRKTIATKPSEWKYEREMRLIFYLEDESNSNQFFKYPTNAIKSLIVGERINDKIKETLFKIIESKRLPISMKIAKRKSNNFKIEIEII